MSANEILREVRALRTRERRRVLQAILDMEADENPKAKAKLVKWPDVEARARQIFGDRVLPNLVLLDREEDGSESDETLR